MNYLLWIRQNRWELLLAAYIIILFASHHTFTPDLYWFRELTNYPLFRIAFLALTTYLVYDLFTHRTTSNRYTNLIGLLTIAYLLTEYHAWNRFPWEFFENGNTEPMIFLKKSGNNLFLTYTNQPNNKVTLSEPHGDFGGQIWKLSVDGSSVSLAPYSEGESNDYTLSEGGSNDYTLSEGLELVSGDSKTWTIEIVDKSTLSNDIITRDDDNVKNFTGGDDAPCAKSDVSYIKLKSTDDGK